MRTLVVWCPDWPVTAAGFPPTEPVAMLAPRVVACSAAARAAGVRLGLRRREAEGRCPGLRLLARDPACEARCFEAVVQAISTLTPRVEVTRPGLCAFETRGPARYFAGEEALCARVTALAAAAMPLTEAPRVRTGVADGRFAAALAARRGVVVPSDATADFLAPFPVTVLGDPELTDLLLRLGLTTLGTFAALAPGMVAARFGRRGERAHELARGQETERLRTAEPPRDLVVRIEYDPPAERVDAAAFAARAPLEALVELLEGRGLTCTRLRIAAETEHGEALERDWRFDGGFTGGSILQRLRWQLDGWLGGTAREPVPTAGITLIRLVPEEVLPATGHQLALLGEDGVARRVLQSLDRLCGMLGPASLFTPVLTGGRGPAERSRLLGWGEARPPAPVAPWPGHHPRPAPGLLHLDPIPAVVLGEEGDGVRVAGRGWPSPAPARLALDGGPWQAITAWAGPWLTDERWWDARDARRRARFQLLTAAQVAHLCFVEGGRWWVEATYD